MEHKMSDKEIEAVIDPLFDRIVNLTQYRDRLARNVQRALDNSSFNEAAGEAVEMAEVNSDIQTLRGHILVLTHSWGWGNDDIDAMLNGTKSE